MNHTAIAGFLDELHKIGHQKEAVMDPVSAGALGILLKSIGFNHLAMRGHKYRPIQYIAGKALRSEILSGAKSGQKYNRLWNPATVQVVNHVLDPRIGTGMTNARELGALLAKSGDNPRQVLAKAPAALAAAEAAVGAAKKMPWSPESAETIGMLLNSADSKLKNYRGIARYASTGVGQDVASGFRNIKDRVKDKLVQTYLAHKARKSAKFIKTLSETYGIPVMQG